MLPLNYARFLVGEFSREDGIEVFNWLSKGVHLW